MLCPTCNKEVVTKTTLEKRGEHNPKHFPEGIPEGSKPKVTVHWCTECGAEIPPIDYHAGEGTGDFIVS